MTAGLPESSFSVATRMAGLAHRMRWGALFVALSAVYSLLAINVPLNSDVAGLLIAARDVAAGNILLQGWDLSTISSYFTEILPYAVFIALFGWHLPIAYAVSGMLLAALVTLAVYLCAQTGSKAWPLLVLIAAPGFLAANILLLPFCHIGSYVVCLAAWWVAARHYESGETWRAAVLALLLTLLLFSDTSTRFTMLLPLAIACVVGMRRRNARGRSAMMLCCIAFAEIGSRLLWQIFLRGDGMHVPGPPALTFASYDRFAGNLWLLARGTLEFFEAHFFGQVVASAAGMNRALHALVLFAVIIFFVRACRRCRQWNFMEVGWGATAVIVVLAYVFSTYPVNVMTTRYLVPAYLFGVMVVVCHLKDRRVPTAVWMAFALVYWLATALPPRLAIPDAPLSKELIKRGLTRGYASYWTATSTALRAEGTRVAPVVFGGKVAPMHWESKREWYSQGGNFLICDNDHQVEMATRQFGEPVAKIEADGKKLLVWSEPFRFE